MTTSSHDHLFMTGRVCAGVFTMLLLLVAPWWVTALVALSLLFYFKVYIEIIALGLFADALYGQPALIPVPLFLTLCAALLLIASLSIRDRLTW